MLQQNTGQLSHPIPVPKKRIEIDSLVDQKMPPSPNGLLRLSELLRDYNSSRSAIVRAISHDPILTARVLRLANSPIYSLEREIVLVDTAVTAIGNQSIYDIVIVEMAARTFNKGINQTEVSQKVWEHSLAVAIIAREISGVLEMRGLEEAFICGLLHDFGKFVLLNHDSEDYEEILKINNEFEMLKAEFDTYGYTHAEVGSLVARRWNLPDEVCYSILNHHNPTQSEQPKIVEHIIDIADILANINGYGVRSEEEEKLNYSESAMKLGFSENFIENVWEGTKDKVTEVINSFK